MGIFILNKMEIIETYKINGRDYHTVETKYGLCRIYALDYKKGHRPTIQTALDKRLYFENMARDVHKDRYDYQFVDYKGYDKKVKITCKIHGEFPQTPHNHLKGNNCTKCARIASSNTRMTYNNGVGNAIVYCLRIEELDGSYFYKIGFTKHSIKYRYGHFFKSKMPYENHEVLWEKVYEQKEASRIESSYHKVLGRYHYIPQLPFAGSKSECFKILGI